METTSDLVNQMKNNLSDRMPDEWMLCHCI